MSAQFDAVMSEILGENEARAAVDAAPAAEPVKAAEQKKPAKPRAPTASGAAFDVFVGTKAALEGEKPRRAASLQHAVSSFVDGQQDDVVSYELTVVKGKDLLMTLRSLKAPGAKQLAFLKKMRGGDTPLKVDKEKSAGKDYIVLRKRKNDDGTAAADKKKKSAVQNGEKEAKKKQKQALGVSGEKKIKKGAGAVPVNKDSIKATDATRKRIEKAMKAMKKDTTAAADV